jgi:hypothetical protein
MQILSASSEKFICVRSSSAYGDEDYSGVFVVPVAVEKQHHANGYQQRLPRHNAVVNVPVNHIEIEKQHQDADKHYDNSKYDFFHFLEIFKLLMLLQK